MGLEKPNSECDRGETFFANSGSDLDSDETFQISRNVGLDIDEIVCLLDSQLWSQGWSSRCRGSRRSRLPPALCSDVPLLPDGHRVGALVVEEAGVADIPLLPAVLFLSYLMVPGLELSL